MFNNIFPWKSYRLWDNVDKYATTGQATDDSYGPNDQKFQHGQSYFCSPPHPYLLWGPLYHSLLSG